METVTIPIRGKGEGIRKHTLSHYGDSCQARAKGLPETTVLVMYAK